MIRRALILSSLIIFSLIFIACNSNNESGDVSRNDSKPTKSKIDDSKPVDGDWLIYHLGAEPGTLNPIVARDVAENRVNSRNIYETLLTRDNESLELMPLLAESWTISEDKLTYTFKLKKNVYWHDGNPFTSDDVVYSYNTIMNPKVDSPHLKGYYQEIKKVEALDEFTVKFTYARPYFLALEFCGGMPIVPKHLFEKGDFNKNPAGRKPIGTGPYKFFRWETGREIILERNEDYWGEKPHIDKVVFRIINDSNVAFQVLKKGEIDYSGLTPIQWVKQSNTKKFKQEIDKHSYFSPNYRFIAWNLDRPFFSDKRVRIAMTHLVNRELILEKILYNLGVIVTNPFYIESKEYDHSIKPYTYDTKKAKELLNQAGWIDSDSDGIRDKNGVKFQFEFLIPNASDTSEKISTILKEEMDKVGIVMNIRKIEWAVFVQRLNERKFDSVTLGWSMGVETDPFQVWHSSQKEGGGSNFIGFDNEQADQILEEARMEFDKEKRIGLYKRFINIIHTEQPYTFLFCNKSTVALNKRFRGVNVYPLGLDTLEWFVPLELQKYH
jgi:peptide/nickel transport system substrate-binding protein